jgi:hypothetical protein
MAMTSIRRELDLQTVDIDNAWPIDRLASLRTLRLRTVSVPLPDTLWQLPELRVLELQSDHVSGVSLPDAIPPNAKLQSLHINYDELSGLPDTISNLVNLTSLRVTWSI